APTMKLQSGYPGGSIFYTLDGSQPTFNSAFYSGPFALSQSAVIRALAYSADFSRSGEAVPVTLAVGPARILTASSGGGGSLSPNPPGGSYADGSSVPVTATPAGGWTFLNWQGDASGANPVITLTMNRDMAAQAVFGTTLSTTAAGGGNVSIYPLST